ncbi:hypothetical protein HAX54_020431 [Datura stramonium]|uniref:Uncharacterized protein n=1 Tax=Datura stramonium TaxID=4076 RepID=A0ABS8Y783_DATST|nr:hypothetical protein [Datura stramonium]
MIAPVWDLGIGLKTVKLVDHTNNVRVYMDISNMFFLHRSSDNISSRVSDTGWKWFRHPFVVHIDYVYSTAIIPTYSPVYSGKGDLSAFQSLEDPKVRFDSFVHIGIREQHMSRSNCVYRNSMISGIVILPGILLNVHFDIGINLFITTCSKPLYPFGYGIWH